MFVEPFCRKIGARISAHAVSRLVGSSAEREPTEARNPLPPHQALAGEGRHGLAKDESPRTDLAARDVRAVWRSWSQLEAGAFETRFSFLEAGPIIISSRSYNVGLKAAATLVPNTSLLAVAADARTRARCLGREFGSSSIALARTSNEMSTAGPSSFCSVLIHEELLAREFATTPDVLALLEKTQKAQLADDPFHANRLRTAIMRFFYLLHESDK